MFLPVSTSPLNLCVFQIWFVVIFCCLISTLYRSVFIRRMLMHWKFKPAIPYIPIIIAIGIALGVADNAIGFQPDLIHAIVLHTLTSLCVGFSLIVITINRDLIGRGQSGNYKLIVMGLLFALVGMVASELEMLVKILAFTDEPYRLFSGGGLYLFNAILSVILGFGIMHPVESLPTGATAQSFEGIAKQERSSTGQSDQREPELSTIPVKKGTSIHLLSVDSLSLLEAADKYAYAYNAAGEKLLCDYSLAFLEKKLPSAFKRIHRSYIINTKEISHIEPFDKKRYVIAFNSVKVPNVTSSAGYQQVVKGLIRI